MDLRVSPSLHLSTLIITLLDREDTCLVLLFNPNCHRISCAVLLRAFVGIQHEYSLCCHPAFCDSIIFRDASEHPCRVWAGTVAQCLRIVRDKVRVGSSHLCRRTFDGFLGGPLSCVFPTTSCVRRSKRVAIYRIHESLKASDDPRRQFVLILLLHRTCNSWRRHPPSNWLSRIQIRGESGETTWRHRQENSLGPSVTASPEPCLFPRKHPSIHRPCNLSDTSEARLYSRALTP